MGSVCSNATKAAPTGRLRAGSTSRQLSESREGASKQAVGGLYVGESVDGKRHGDGKFSYPNGDWYNGTWENNKANGEGTFWTRESQYVGEWEMDLKHGTGEEAYRSGFAYRGQYRSGCRHGQGILKYPDGSTYTGEFISNNQEGVGEFQWKTKSAYNGQWTDNYMHGDGKFEWTDGSTYTGQYNMNLKDGRGIYINREGQMLECKWEDGKPGGHISFSAQQYDSPDMECIEGVLVSWGARSEASTPRETRGRTARNEGGDTGRKSTTQSLTSARGDGGLSARRSEVALSALGGVAASARKSRG